ncbi:5-guanidino-2-oxopentanoate decarboxylase [Roseovarius sp. 2305UL8-3]|uniref:5-guanidino-2-oxopentanoate decarboxylase n=1 Tax=Roseovarius conchicola TaxID=3121636 RepID=UPI0035278DF0
MNVGEAVVKLLEMYGVKAAFGIPGTHTLEYYRGLVGSSMQHVLPRHEQGCSFAADGYARASGEVGVCFLIAGCGLLNASTGIAAAYNDSIPMLVMSSVTNRPALNKAWGEGHELRKQTQVMECYTAFSATAILPEDVPHLIAKAFAVFDGPRPRPVHIEIPTDVLLMDVEQETFDREWSVRRRPTLPWPNAGEIAEAARLLESAERPVICVGGGARGAVAEVNELVAKTGALVTHSAKGMGICPASHPQTIGSVSLECARNEMEAADVLLVIGSELAVVDRLYAPLTPRGKMIRIDVDPIKFTDQYSAEVAINGDAAKAVRDLCAEISQPVGADKLAAAITRADKVRAETVDVMRPIEQKYDRILKTAQSALPSTTVYYGDMCQFSYAALYIGQFEKPNYHYPAGLGCLGFALPAAIGGKINHPDDPVVVLIGDSGFQYTVQELATCIDEDLPLIVLVANNFELSAIREGFDTRGIEYMALTPTPPDHAKLAESFGWQYAGPSDHKSLTAAIEQAVASGAPTIIEIVEADDY